jgi:hypothetical protein
VKGPPFGSPVRQRARSLKDPVQDLHPRSPSLVEGQRLLDRPPQAQHLLPTPCASAPCQHAQDGVYLGEQEVGRTLSLRPRAEIGQGALRPGVQVPSLAQLSPQVAGQAVARAVGLCQSAPLQRLEGREDVRHAHDGGDVLGGQRDVLKDRHRSEDLLCGCREGGDGMGCDRCGRCLRLASHVDQRATSFAHLRRGPDEPERMAFERRAEEAGSGLLLWGQRAADAPLDEGQGIVEGQSAQFDGPSPGPQAALWGSEYKGAARRGVHQGLDRVPRQLYVVEQDKGLLCLEAVSDLALTGLVGKVAFVERVKEGLQEVCEGPLSRAEVNGPLRESGYREVMGQVMQEGRFAHPTWTVELERGGGPESHSGGVQLCLSVEQPGEGIEVSGGCPGAVADLWLLLDLLDDVAVQVFDLEHQVAVPHDHLPTDPPRHVQSSTPGR